MAKTKQIQTTEMTGHTYARIQLIDSMLFRMGHLPERNELLKMVNRRLDEPIAMRTLDDDIQKIRRLLAKRGGRVRLLFRDNGYRYSEKGFSLFGCPVSEDDARLLELGGPLFHLFFGEETALLYQNFCRRVMGMIPGVGEHAFKELPFGCIVSETVGRGEGGQWLPGILTAIRDRQTLRVALRGNGGMSDHLSPYRLVEGRNGWELEAHRYDPTGVTEGRIGRFPLCDIKGLSVSNRYFREEHRFLTDHAVEVKVHRMRQRREEHDFEGMDDHGIRA